MNRTAFFSLYYSPSALLALKEAHVLSAGAVIRPQTDEEEEEIHFSEELAASATLPRSCKTWTWSGDQVLLRHDGE